MPEAGSGPLNTGAGSHLALTLPGGIRSHGHLDLHSGRAPSAALNPLCICDTLPHSHRTVEAHKLRCPVLPCPAYLDCIARGLDSVHHRHHARADEAVGGGTVLRAAEGGQGRVCQCLLLAGRWCPPLPPSVRIMHASSSSLLPLPLLLPPGLLWVCLSLLPLLPRLPLPPPPPGEAAAATGEGRRRRQGGPDLVPQLQFQVARICWGGGGEVAGWGGKHLLPPS